MSKEKDSPKIIFILGIMPRSGTHFLANLLCRHPDCGASVIPEDGLLGRAGHLTQYANHLVHVWKMNGDFEKVQYLSPKKLIWENLGRGLLDFLVKSKKIALKKHAERFPDHPQKMPKYLVTKTPQVFNLNKFFKLFPEEKLLIIVRDGRALVESINKSFNYPREEAIRDWATAARRIFEFEDREKKNKDKYLIVKYENLHSNTESEMRKILEFLELDINRYDFQKALDLPVVGSSTFKRGAGGVHWNPVRKTEKFNPLARADGWTRSQHERFNWLAEDEAEKLGYETAKFDNEQILRKIRHKFYDFIWESNIWLKRFKRIPLFIKKRYKIYFGK